MTGAAPALVLFGFLGSATVVVLAGVFLARSGDVIAARTRLGGLWVGSVFLAFATSLPEIATDVVAVRMGLPDLAAGDLFGSSMANMLILALISLLPAGAGLFRKAAMDHALYASLAIVLTCIAAATILVRPTTTLVGIGPGSLMLLLVYVVYHLLDLTFGSANPAFVAGDAYGNLVASFQRVPVSLAYLAAMAAY